MSMVSAPEKALDFRTTAETNKQGDFVPSEKIVFTA